MPFLDKAAELPEWVQNLDATSRLQAIFIRLAPMPSGLVPVRRPPRETRPALTQMIAAAPSSASALALQAPSDAELVALRAMEAEQDLDFAAAEADWKKHAQLAADPAAGQMALADFYHRRLRPLEEVQSLAAAARFPSPPSERLVPEREQRAWKAFQRIFTVIEAHALPASASSEQYRAWMVRYPRASSVYRQFFDFLLAGKDFSAAEQLIAGYQKAFPSDTVFPVKARASLAYRRGSLEQALAVYDRAFRPLWPPELVKDYFSLLQETRGLRSFLDRARSALAANPDDLNAAARVFYYYQQQGNLPAAERALVEFRLRKESRKAPSSASALALQAPWKAEELLTLARLLEGVHNVDEAARLYYALYSLPGADASHVERALAGITNLLFTAPEQPIRLGAGDLSFYRDVAVLDPYPGFLNGILSLLLNSTDPAARYAEQERASVAYFHRARAAELLSLFDARFPKSPQRAGLHARLLEAYATYGDNDGVVRGGRDFLAAFPRAAQRTRVALLMAEAYARKNQVQQEFSTYDALLQELAARAQGVPLGPGVLQERPAPAAEAEEEARGPATPPAEQEEGEEEGVAAPAARGTVRDRVAGILAGLQPAPSSASPIRASALALQAPGRNAGTTARAARSPEYARVLDRYISRLVAMKRLPQALALYRREIDRNPNDPGLYERLAAFLEQNRMAAEVEQVYRRAIAQFSDRSWHHRLARWYLRRKQAAQFEQFTREVVRIFSGSDLEKYFREVVGQGAVAPLLYRQLNLYAHERFPHNLTFVHNLLAAYTRRETADRAAWERLLRSYWFYDNELRSRFFEFLSATGRLKPELEALRASQPAAAAGKWPDLAGANPAAAQFLAEAEAWQSHFEQAAPALRALAAVYPADAALGRRAAAVARSLAAFDPANTAAAVTIEENLQRSKPRERATLARLGDLYADREMFDKARPYWNRMAEVEPGKPDGYLDAATVFWDYFLFDDALRLIGEGRKKLDRPTLDAYEAGAIYENKRDFARAVEEYVNGALEQKGESPPARSRLLELARRTGAGATPVRSIIEEATRKRVSGANPDWPAVLLRAHVLEAQNRREELENFLLSLVESSTSLELLTRVDGLAVQQGFETVRRRSLEREITLTTDPVDRMRLRLALARFHEGRRDLDAARQVMDELDRDYPTTLGVVRATVDFYWRNKLAGRAVEVLVRAAAASHPALKKQFTFEAARKSTEAGQYEPARKLLAPLLEEDPFRADYLAAMADTYARAGDDRALRDFYTAKVQALGKAELAAEERDARIAALRRGLIPALTRLKDPAAAVDQYVEIINRFPEDEGLIQEAALYAARYNRQQQLLAYYTKTAAGSPRDFRWPMVLGRLQTHFENFPEAIAAYARATAIRPDRTDLHAARAGLEERVMRFDDALADYSRLYELTYRNPQWMEKVAEIRARQGKTAEAVEALRKALVEGRPERPQNFFEVAQRLESWNMLPQAREWAERGLHAAGNELLVDSDYFSGAQVYARVMTRLREHEAAYTRLMAAAKAAPPNRGYPGLQPALRQMGDAAARFFTPEEKSALAAFLEKRKAEPDEFVAALVPLAESAGLADLEARWRYELMMARPGQPAAEAHQRRLVELQKRRMKFNELGTQLESYWQVYPAAPNKDNLLEEAAASYRAAENTEAEVRVLSLREQRGGLPANLLEHYFELLREREPQRLVALAGSDRSGGVRNAAANFAIAAGDAGLAFGAVAARGSNLPPVWTRAYTGLVGLYYRDASPQVNGAFQAALGSATIGDRIGKPVDRRQQLAGDIWFYYGSRYGEFQAMAKQGEPEDYLPAMLEGTPGRAAAYFTMAEYYRQSGDAARALADYAHTLELDPQRGDAHDRVATVLWDQGKQAEATARWKSALETFGRLLDQRRVPEAFWTDVRMTLENIGRRKLLAAVRPEADRLLRTYVRRNGSYRVEPLLQAALEAAADPAGGVAWIVDLSRAAPNPVSFLGSIAEAAWLPEAQRERVFERIVEAAEEELSQAHGEARSSAEENLHQWQVRLLERLVAARQAERAQAMLNAYSEEARRRLASALVPLEIRIAAQAGRLEALLERYRQDPEKAPPLEYARNAAATLRSEGDESSARRVLDFVYTRELEQRNFTAANFLGLAEVRLETGDSAGALAALRRMTLVSGEPFTNLEPAAALLEKAGRHAEAVEFLSSLVRATPWNADAQVRLAAAVAAKGTSPGPGPTGQAPRAGASPDVSSAQLAASREREASLRSLVSVAGAREAAYETRVAAALLLGKTAAAAAKTGSAELDLLTSGGPQDAAAAEKPFFYRARLQAAERAPDPAVRLRLLRGAIEIEPGPEAARFSLFHAALDSGRYQLAVSSLEPFLERSGFRYLLERLEAPSAQEESEPWMPRRRAESFFSGSSFNPAQRALLARGLATAFEKLNQLRAVDLLLRVALELEPSSEKRATLKQNLETLKAERELQRQNALRRPVVTENLEQGRLVRPRLTEFRVSSSEFRVRKLGTRNLERGTSAARLAEFGVRKLGTRNSELGTSPAEEAAR